MMPVFVNPSDGGKPSPQDSPWFTFHHSPIRCFKGCTAESSALSGKSRPKGGKILKCELLCRDRHRRSVIRNIFIGSLCPLRT